MSAPAWPKTMFSGVWNAGHAQGAAIDKKHGYVYYSFTTMLVKTTLEGEVLGSVAGLVGHLGCLAFNPADGRVYASLEYKNDVIGRAVSEQLGAPGPQEDGFYVAIFDGAKITRCGMHAERDGIMTSVHLAEVLNDYSAVAGVPPRRHRYGCSGIDGITFGPPFGGAAGGAQCLYVAYGVYGDVQRSDNDHQVLLCYDTGGWARYERPMRQSALHREGPQRPNAKLFVFTGNTLFGIQNLEYDAHTHSFLAAVYRGAKPQYPNHSLFQMDAAQPPRRAPLAGVGEEGLQVPLAAQGLPGGASAVRGWESRWGTTGLVALGGGLFYLSQEGKNEQGQFTRLVLHRWRGEAPCPFEEVE